MKPESDLANQNLSSLQTGQATKPPEALPQCATSPWMYHPDEDHGLVSETRCVAMAGANSAALESADVEE